MQNANPLKDRFSYRPVQETVYAQTDEGDLTASLHFPYNWNEHDRRPAIIFFFGGGFHSGTRHQFDRQATYFASRGMVAVTADYRIRSLHDTDTVTCFEDAFAALSWLGNSHKEYGIDPERIVCGGGSAGGALALGTAVLDGFEYGHPRPIALVLFNPAIGYRRIASGQYDHRVEGFDQTIANLGLDTATINRISMEERITAELPPAFVWFGTGDRWLLPGQDVFATAKKLGCRIDMTLVEDADHGYFNAPLPFFESSLQAADDFLCSIHVIDPLPMHRQYP